MLAHETAHITSAHHLLFRADRDAFGRKRGERVTVAFTPAGDCVQVAHFASNRLAWVKTLSKPEARKLYAFHRAAGAVRPEDIKVSDTECVEWAYIMGFHDRLTF